MPNILSTRDYYKPFEYPWAFLKAESMGTWTTFFMGGGPKFFPEGHRFYLAYLIPTRVYKAWNAFIFILGFYFLVFKSKLLLKNGRSFTYAVCVFSVMLITYFTIMTSPSGVPRYRFPFLPAIYFLAAMGFYVYKNGSQDVHRLKNLEK